MKKRVRLLSVILASAMAVSMLAGCGGGEEKKNDAPMPEVEVDPDAKVELNGEEMSLADLVSKAQEEGDIQSVGMPDDWANWKGSWEGINTTYGLTHGDVDMTSAEELSQFAAEKDDPTKDVGDIGLSMTPEAIKQDVIGSFKASTWDQFPDWAKDPAPSRLSRTRNPPAENARLPGKR